MRSFGFAATTAWVLAAVVVAAAPSRARAEPVYRLRFATIAPEGTGWAREVQAFVREIEGNSGGRVGMHVYFGGIAGDDTEMGRRMRKDQLDGALSGGMLCQEVAPAFAIFRVPGLMQNRDEGAYVLTRLFPALREQARAPAWCCSTPARSAPTSSCRGCQSIRWRRCGGSSCGSGTSTALGVVRARDGHAPGAAAGHRRGQGVRERQTDGFIAVPSAVFGFQWFSRQLYMSRLPFARCSAAR